MKKRSFKLAAALLLTAMLAAAAGCACTGGKTPMPSARPSASPLMPSASPSARPTQEAMNTAEASLSPSANASEAASSPGADAIEGFMEGGIVDPDDVPELTALLSRSTEYADMAIQSITYKLYEGRQAYYVILQGEGDASHPVYVFADDSIVPAEMGGND